MNLRERAEELTRSRVPFVRATVVRAQHPTSARSGDEAIVLEDGTIEGFVGGQCAESSVRAAGLDALRSGESVLLRVLPDGDDHFPETPGAQIVVNPCLSSGALEIYLAPRLPAPVVRISGATPVATALGEICEMLGYEVRRDGDPDWAQTVAVVIASQGGPEAETLRAALDAGAGYIGLVASPVRGAAVLDEAGIDEADRARVHTPVGLPIGARTPAEIAVSIAAELVSAFHRGLAAVDDRAGEEAHDLPGRAVDPVCGMTVAPSPATEHQRIGGIEYWFCSPGCRTVFAEARAGV